MTLINNDKKLFPLYERRRLLHKELKQINEEITDLEKVRYRTTADILYCEQVMVTIPFIYEVVDVSGYTILGFGEN